MQYSMIDGCSCPRDAGGKLVAPKCAVETCMGFFETLLFVTRPPQAPECDCLFNFGNGYICSCKQRLHVYQTRGI